MRGDRLKTLGVASLLCTVFLSAPIPVQGAEDHWAVPEAKRLTDWVGWSAPASLDRPISPSDWHDLVGRLLDDGEKKALGLTEDNLWQYTINMARGDSVTREDAIGGLVKLLTMSGMDLGAGETVLLQRFNDYRTVSDQQGPLLAMAVRSGLVVGTPEQALHPTDRLTYGEASALAVRVLSRKRSGVEGPVPVSKPTPEPPTGVESGSSEAGVVSQGVPSTVAGHVEVWVRGATYTTDSETLGPAPAGHQWVLVDVTVTNMNKALASPSNDEMRLRFSLEDSLVLLFHDEPDLHATAALGSPFARATVQTNVGQAVRGMVVFTVPEGTKGIWYHVEVGVGASKDPTYPYNSGHRGLLGDLPGPEPVYPESRPSK